MDGLTAELQRDDNINTFVTFAAFAFLYYEYFITLDLEIYRFWRYPKNTAPVILFFVNRYVALLGHVPVIAQHFVTERLVGSHEGALKMCHTFDIYHQFYAVLIQIIVGYIMVFRTYAFYERSKKILALLVCITVAAIAVGCWSILSSPGDVAETKGIFPILGCPSDLSKGQSSRLAIAWAGVVVFDTTVFILTLYKALLFRTSASGPLLTILLRDGSMYFGIMAVTTTGNIVSFLIGHSRTRGCATTFTNCMSSVLVSRLMFNIRDPRISTTRQGSQHHRNRPSNETSTAMSFVRARRHGHDWFGYGEMTTVQQGVSTFPVTSGVGTFWTMDDPGFTASMPPYKFETDSAGIMTPSAPPAGTSPSSNDTGADGAQSRRIAWASSPTCNSHNEDSDIEMISIVQPRRDEDEDETQP